MVDYHGLPLQLSHVCFMGIVRRLFDSYILTVLFFSLTPNWVGSEAQWEGVSFSG